MMAPPVDEGSVFDFVVVGGLVWDLAGPAGSVIAARLAKTSTAPQVLLLEAGELNVELTHRVAGARYTFWNTEDGAKYNYRYKSVPEPELARRELVYDRGHGLGGSTSINIGLWDYGRKEEMEEWARLVDDDAWTWNGLLTRIKKIERFHNDTPAEFRDGPDPANHGTNGPLDVTLPSTWTPGLQIVLDGAKKYGFPVLSSLYSGNLGMGVVASTTYKGLRTTAATAYLTDAPSNLSIKTGSIVARVLFDGKKAVGVELTDGTKYFASKEIILSAGAIDTPKILLLSGVGPQEELAKHSIPVVSNLPAVGRNLKDHYLVQLQALVRPGTVPNVSLSDLASWQAQWTKDQTGPLALDPGMLALGYFQLDNLATFPEFQQLDERTRAIVPIPGAEKGIIQASVILMNAQSSGRVSLKSSDPITPPILELNYLQHPYDRRVYIEAIKKAVDYMFNSDMPVTEQIQGPKSTSDNDILQFLREHIGPAWHALGTVKMGKVDEDTTCVDPEFRVVGLNNLRVADMSANCHVCSNHTQSTAYLIGEVAADKLIKEYNL
ncbi:GMC oxidoreductase [Penicillium lagena]|uniref:GMC oxidoreductase n=1 Tax=Penicillium lagena TaxID=94218 RepID=UPI00254154FF|nr:GMC oxidoreductase [Penicillium lagena]KAJ5612027.1 GMC oxidoreductase [Penicillium lagena]